MFLTQASNARLYNMCPLHGKRSQASSATRRSGRVGTPRAQRRQIAARAAETDASGGVTSNVGTTECVCVRQSGSGAHETHMGAPAERPSPVMRSGPVQDISLRRCSLRPGLLRPSRRCEHGGLPACVTGHERAARPDAPGWSSGPAAAPCAWVVGPRRAHRSAHRGCPPPSCPAAARGPKAQ